MFEARRLLAVGAILGVAAILTCTDVWGEPGRDKDLKDWRKGDGKLVKPDDKDAGPPADDLNGNRFVDLPVVVYQPDTDVALAGIQIKPKLPDAPVRPKDYLVIVDTSASKAMGPLAIAHQITYHLSKKLGADDRVAIWTANITPKDLTRGFKSGKALEDAVTNLAKEVPMGAVNLKKTLNDALATFEVKESRQRLVLFLGDGKSVADPLDSTDRAALCETMVKKQVAFFAVPLGMRLDSQNLHTLISGTGGKTIRPGVGEKSDHVVDHMLKDVAEPILYNVEFSLPATVKDFLPSKLPPLRRDAATLVVGKFAPGTKAIDYKLSGTVAGKDVRVDASLPVPAADVDHFFLVSIYDQWKGARDRPALLQADRALAYAHKQNQIALEDVLSKGEMALELNKLDLAQKLFEQAKVFAPHSERAKGGVLLVERMKTGKKSRADMLKELRLGNASREVARIKDGKRTIVVLADGDEKKDDPKPGVEGRDPLDDVKARREIAEQQATLLVAEAVRQANRLVRTSPDEAYELLKRTLDGVKSNDALGCTGRRSSGRRGQPGNGKRGSRR